eukprot:89043-Amphidinium_carterae.1
MSGFLKRARPCWQEGCSSGGSSLGLSVTRNPGSIKKTSLAEELFAGFGQEVWSYVVNPVHNDDRNYCLVIETGSLRVKNMEQSCWRDTLMSFETGSIGCAVTKPQA